MIVCCSARFWKQRPGRSGRRDRQCQLHIEPAGDAHAVRDSDNDAPVITSGTLADVIVEDEATPTLSDSESLTWTDPDLALQTYTLEYPAPTIA